MFQSKSGKPFGNIFQARKHDEMHAEPETATMKAKHETTTNADMEEPKDVEGAEPEVEEEEGEQHPMVAEHGRAHSVHIRHDHETGKHHVQSTHEDGHENLSEHATAEEAHAEGGKLAACANCKEEKKKPQPGAEAESDDDGFEMPSLG